MNLIKRIEISYFRSIYKETLQDLRGSNVLFGRNDSGKSNVLRALNLFFNGETNPGQEFTFDRDFCHARLAEANPERDVRKFVYVKLWFRTPDSWKRSLGEEFWVKKQWSVTRAGDPQITSSISEHRLQQYLTRFLKKVRFFYIPAIKDRSIFEKLLGDIYHVVASQEAFSNSLEDFSLALRERTSELSSSLRFGLGIQSIISPPEDLTDLFRSLDFETNTEQGDSYSLTLQRGDGIQVRHIPEILSFLSDKSSEDYHLWGFEEPENSLELANAIEEAESFCRHGSQWNKQIFLTSHSPAFFALEDGRVARYFVSRSQTHGERLTSRVSQIRSDDPRPPSDLMGETPHLPVVSAYLKESHKKIKDLEEQSASLTSELEHGNRSLIFVEGESDAVVLEAAWHMVFDRDPPFDFEPAGGTTKMGSLGRDGRVLNRLAPERQLLVVVDNDREGRSLYKNGRLDNGGSWVAHGSNGTYWCRLPFTRRFIDFMERAEVPKSEWPATLENMFDPDLRERAIEEGVLALSVIPHSELLDPAIYRKIEPYIRREDLDRHWILTVDEDYKVPFAQWVIRQAMNDGSILEPFQEIVVGIDRILRDLDEMR